MNLLTSQIIVDILNEEMVMPKNSVWIRDQNMKIPDDNNLYIIVGFVSSGGIVGNSTYITTEVVDSVPVVHEINQVQILENIQIDILSRSNAALQRSWEVIAALQSIYAQQQQELNNFKIFRQPSGFLNTSEAEGGSTLNRFTITVSCLVWYRKDVALVSTLGDYYDDFTTRVDDEATIGTDTPLIEFEITPDSPPPL